MKRFLFPGILGFLFLSGISGYCAPSISNVTYSGTLAAGTTVTITGTAFSTGPLVAIYDTFEYGTANSSITAGAVADYGDWDGVTTDTCAPVYTTSDYYSGSQSIVTYSDCQPNLGEAYAELRFSSATNVFMCMDWLIVGDWPGYYNTGAGSGVNNKFGWLMYNNSTTNTDFYFAYFNSSTHTAPNSYGYYSNDASPYSKTFSFNASTTSADPRTEADWHMNCSWVNGLPPGDIKFVDRTSTGTFAVRYTTTNLTTPFLSEPANQQTYWTLAHFPGYLRNDPKGSQQKFHQDNIYVSTGTGAAAHAVMFDQPYLHASTKRVILKPVTWTDTEITATLLSHAFSDGAAYFSVCDAQWICDDTGYAVTIGASQAAGASGASSTQKGITTKGVTFK